MDVVTPVPADCYRVNVNWDLAVEGQAKTEQGLFSFGGHRHHVAGTSTDEDFATQAIANKTRDAWLTTLGAISYFGSSVTFTKVDCYHLDAATGRATTKGTAAFDGVNALAGKAPDSMPWESCLVVELLAHDTTKLDPQRRRKTGRIFLPVMGPGPLDPNGSGEFLPAALGFVGDAAGAFFNSVQGVPINDNPLGDADSLEVGVISRKYVSFSQLERVRVSSKFHHQRRRELKEGSFKAESVIAHN